MGSPIRRLPEKPRWVFTCKTPETTTSFSIEIDETMIYDEILSRARFSLSHANKTMQKFLSALNNNDPTFVKSTEHMRQGWLPKIPNANEEQFKEKQPNEWLKEVVEYLQYFAVGFEQIVLDRTISTGVMMELFNDVQSYLYQILCETLAVMQMKGVKPDPDVERDVMSKQYRHIEVASQRDIRDYIILREYIKMTNFIVELFEYLRTAASAEDDSLTEETDLS